MVVCTMCVIMFLQNNKKKIWNGHLFAFCKRFVSRPSFPHCSIEAVDEKRTKMVWKAIVCTKWARSLFFLCISVCICILHMHSQIKLFSYWSSDGAMGNTNQFSFFSKFISHCILHYRHFECRFVWMRLKIFLFISVKWCITIVSILYT